MLRIKTKPEHTYLNPLKQLAGQTAIYGLSSIVARLLNYLLTPLHTSKGVFSAEQYGIITEMYSYVAFLIIFLTYGLETAFFRFINKNPDNKSLVYATGVKSLVVTSSVFITMATLFNVPIGKWLNYPDHTEYVVWFAIIVGLDALSTMPMAKLRAENKALKFAGVNLVNVLINIGLNLFFLAYCMPHYAAGDTNWLIDAVYSPDIGVGYVFIANLVASSVKFLLLSPHILRARGFDFAVLKTMLRFSLPLLLVGIGWYINENFDRIMLKFILTDLHGEKYALEQVGIYGANYKLSIIIMLFIQAFRYAADPFYFSKEKEAGSKKLYASIMNYFLIIVCTIFLVVTLYIDIFKYFIPNDEFWVGLSIVPILLMANIFQGMYYNLSFWYKLTDKTYFGAILALLGALVTLGLNFFFIPEYGYMACAWTTCIAYGSIMLLSYFIGQRHYAIPYRVGRILVYVLMAFSIYMLFNFISIDSNVLKWLLAAVAICAFVLVSLRVEGVKLADIRAKLSADS